MKTFSNTIFGGLNPGSIIIMMILCFVAIIGHLFGWRVDAGDVPILMGMSVLTQGNTIQDILKWEQEMMHSREAVTVASGQDLALGTVIGKVTKSTPTTGTADVGNTGSGTCTGVTAGAKTKVGVYTLTALSATAFAVKDPDGLALPDAVVGTAYENDNINFTINDGSPDFIAGDIFTITVAAGAGSVKIIDFDAVDGTQNAYGFTIAAYDASGGAISGVAIVRDATIVAADLVWPTASPAPTVTQKAAALAELAAKGIIEATEV